MYHYENWRRGRRDRDRSRKYSRRVCVREKSWEKWETLYCGEGERVSFR
jgi:hypothetical protein